MKNSKLITALKKHQKVISSERDKMRETISEFENLEEVCTRAIDAVEEAIYALSEAV
jgi:hypothetical protein